MRRAAPRVRWADAELGGQLVHLAGDPALVPLRRVRTLRVQPLVPRAPDAGWCCPSHAMNHSRAPGRRWSTRGVTEVAPEAAIARTVARSWSGWSPRNGITGAIRTPQPMPCSVSVRTASRRRSGAGVPGSTVRHSSWSRKPTETRDADLGHLGRLLQQLQVAQDERALGEDGERVRVVAQGLDDARHQAVTAFRALVAVDIGAHRDVRALPAARGEVERSSSGALTFTTICESKPRPVSRSR